MSKKKSNLNFNSNDFSKIKFFYGVPHCHTNISTGKGSPLECIEMAYRNDLDFLILTDHNSSFKKDSKSNNWISTNKLISKHSKKGSNFIVIQGFEAHSSEWGHFNIINSPNYFSGIITNITSLVFWTLKDKNTIVSINHPHDCVLKIPYAPILNSCITSLEVGNGILGKKYTKHDKIYYSMLDKGWRLSAINGQDNHKLNIGKEENLTGILATNLSTESIVDAFRNHHTFSTESKSLKMFFTINNIFMGSELKAKSGMLLKFFISVEDTNKKISKIEIISSGGTIVKEISNLGIHTVKFMYQQKATLNEKWYVIKTYLKDKREAISSPIFLNF